MSGETGQSLPGADGDIKLNGGGAFMARGGTAVMILGLFVIVIKED